MIPECYLQSLLQSVPNAVAASKKELKSITGHPTEKRIA